MPDQPLKPRSELYLAQLLPNLLTISAMCAGMTGIRFAIIGQFSAAVAMILVAAVLDGLDGRIARLLRSESEIGAELDSLVDFVNFGVAPGLIIYMWGLHNLQSGGWIATLIYAACCLLRLARFNIGNRPSAGQTRRCQLYRRAVACRGDAGAAADLCRLHVARLRRSCPRRCWRSIWC